VVKIAHTHFHKRTNFKAERLGNLDHKLELGWRHSRPATLAAWLWNSISPPALMFIHSIE